MRFCAYTLAGIALTVTGCATTPPAIRQAPPQEPSFLEVLGETERHVGKCVRWGGTILSIENKQMGTWIEVLEQKLRRSGEPKQYSRSDGRFLAHVPHFVDPAIYAKGRTITIAGIVTGSERRAIGEQLYSYPIVRAQDYFLWGPTHTYYPPYRYYSPHHGYYYGYGYHHHFGFHFGHHRPHHFGHRHNRYGLHLRFHH